jgi:hypothetical protein
VPAAATDAKAAAPPTPGWPMRRCARLQEVTKTCQVLIVLFQQDRREPLRRNQPSNRPSSSTTAMPDSAARCAPAMPRGPDQPREPPPAAQNPLPRRSPQARALEPRRSTCSGSRSGLTRPTMQLMRRSSISPWWRPLSLWWTASAGRSWASRLALRLLGVNAALIKDADRRTEHHDLGGWPSA